MDYYYISGERILKHISNLNYFSSDYYDKYIKKFTETENNLIGKDVDEVINNIKENDNNIKPLIFITKIEYLDDLYNKILKSLTSKFVLITHYGDMEAGHHKILSNPLLIKWYGQNMGVNSNKTCAIPIGLESVFWKRVNFSTIKKHANNSKEKLLYLNFSENTNPNRKYIMKILLNKGFKKNVKMQWNKYIEDLSRHKFCLSPNGNGVDTHRTWECLYLGVIPIVEKSIHMNYFNDLPILFVDSYDVICVEYLNEVYDKFKDRSFNLDKLSISYWKTKILEDFK